MDVLYQNMKETLEDTNNSLVAISKVEKTLQTYTRDLGIIFAVKQQQLDNQDLFD